MSSVVRPTDNMRVTKKATFGRRLRKAKADLLVAFFQKYRKCVGQLKSLLSDESSQRADRERRRSLAKLQPHPDRPIRRVVTAKMHRNPSSELERLRRKGENWTANDLFRFQYGDPEEGEPDERRALCLEWLHRLHAISKKYCYLAWYASAVYACYYRLAPLVAMEEKKKLWDEVTREYADMFLMGRRIWRRPTHPSRLRVFYDLAMLCVRFASLQDDVTVRLFRTELNDAHNFDFKVLNEVEFANSIDKVVRLENHVIALHFVRRRSTCSSRSSFRSRRSTMTNAEHSPHRGGAGETTDEEASFSRRGSLCAPSQQAPASSSSSSAHPPRASSLRLRPAPTRRQPPLAAASAVDRSFDDDSSVGDDVPAAAAAALAKLAISTPAPANRENTKKKPTQHGSAPPSPTASSRGGGGGVIPKIVVDTEETVTPAATNSSSSAPPSRKQSVCSPRPPSPKQQQSVRFADSNERLAGGGGGGGPF